MGLTEACYFCMFVVLALMHHIIFSLLCCSSIGDPDVAHLPCDTQKCGICQTSVTDESLEKRKMEADESSDGLLFGPVIQGCMDDQGEEGPKKERIYE